jgi:general secretion pathway protein H
MAGHEGSWSLGRVAPELSRTGSPAVTGRAPVKVTAGTTERRARGFTLLEILLAVALIGLLAAALVPTSLHLIGDQPVTPDDVFWQASREARKMALKSEHEVRLSFDEKEKNFVVTDGVGSKTFTVPPVRDLTIDFLQGKQGKGSVLIGGQLVDTRTLPFVSFFADGTCVPFRVQFRTGGPARILTIDPWTCAPVIVSSDNTY